HLRRAVRLLPAGRAGRVPRPRRRYRAAHRITNELESRSPPSMVRVSDTECPPACPTKYALITVYEVRCAGAVLRSGLRAYSGSGEADGERAFVSTGLPPGAVGGTVSAVGRAGQEERPTMSGSGGEAARPCGMSGWRRDERCAPRQLR